MRELTVSCPVGLYRCFALCVSCLSPTEGAWQRLQLGLHVSPTLRCGQSLQYQHAGHPALPGWYTLAAKCVVWGDSFFNTRWKKWVMSEWWLIAAEKQHHLKMVSSVTIIKHKCPLVFSDWLKGFPFFFYCIHSCHGYVYVYVWSDTSNFLLFFVSLLWRTTWSLLQDCCWGWIPPQDQDTCVLWVWQKNRINEKKEAQCSPYALIEYAIMCCSRWK